jgi:hypothetical protein
LWKKPGFSAGFVVVVTLTGCSIDAELLEGSTGDVPDFLCSVDMANVCLGISLIAVEADDSRREETTP